MCLYLSIYLSIYLYPVLSISGSPYHNVLCGIITLIHRSINMHTKFFKPTTLLIILSNYVLLLVMIPVDIICQLRTKLVLYYLEKTIFKVIIAILSFTSDRNIIIIHMMTKITCNYNVLVKDILHIGLYIMCYSFLSENRDGIMIYGFQIIQGESPFYNIQHIIFIHNNFMRMSIISNLFGGHVCMH